MEKTVNKTMDKAQKKKYVRMIYSKSLNLFGIALVLCAVAGGLAGSRLYFVFASCAAGAVFICLAWFTYMRRTGLRVFGFSPNKKTKTPYMYRRFKRSSPHRPSFAVKNDDFDDDLVSATSVDEEAFDEPLQGRARGLSRLFCGILLIAVSLAMHYI